MRSIKNFFLSLISSNNANSSKRFAGLAALFTCISLAITATVKANGLCPDSMFTSLLIFSGCCFGFNMAENILKNKEQSAPAEAAPVIDVPVIDTPVEDVVEVPGNTEVDNPDA